MKLGFVCQAEMLLEVVFPVECSLGEVSILTFGEVVCLQVLSIWFGVVTKGANLTVDSLYRSSGDATCPAFEAQVLRFFVALPIMFSCEGRTAAECAVEGPIFGGRLGQFRFSRETSTAPSLPISSPC